MQECSGGPLRVRTLDHRIRPTRQGVDNSSGDVGIEIWSQTVSHLSFVNNLINSVEGRKERWGTESVGFGTHVFTTPSLANGRIPGLPLEHETSCLERFKSESRVGKEEGHGRRRPLL